MVAEAGWVAVSAKDTKSATLRPAFEFLNRKFILSSGCRFLECRGWVERAAPSFLYIQQGFGRVPGSIRLEPPGDGLSSGFPRPGTRLCKAKNLLHHGL